MLARILIDNISDKKYSCEWGLSIHIEHEGKNLLLDTGASGKFRENAKKMGIDLEEVDYGILSHAHYDHADGMDNFFRINSKAPFYLSGNCKENCYGRRWIFGKYIGIEKGVMKKYESRIIAVKEKTQICKNAYVLPRGDGDFSLIGKKAGLYIRENRRWIPDSFSHEQSLVLRTQKGLVVFNSCSHTGVSNILSRVRSAFPNEKITAYIGGLHLYRSDEEEIIALSEEIRESGIEKIYTGHCTGDKAFKILKEKLGDKAVQLKVGLEIEI